MNTPQPPLNVPPHSKWDMFHRTVHRLSTVFGVVSAGMIVLSVLITCQMIFLRKVLGQSTVWQTEMVVYLVIAATVLGTPYVQMTRGHVHMDFVPLLLSHKHRRILQSVTTALTLIVVAVMGIYGAENFLYAWHRNLTSDTVWGVSLWIPYSVIPIGFGAMGIQLLSDLILCVQGKDINDYLNTHNTPNNDEQQE